MSSPSIRPAARPPPEINTRCGLIGRPGTRGASSTRNCSPICRVSRFSAMRAASLLVRSSLKIGLHRVVVARQCEILGFDPRHGLDARLVLANDLPEAALFRFLEEHLPVQTLDLRTNGTDAFAPLQVLGRDARRGSGRSGVRRQRRDLLLEVGDLLPHASQIGMAFLELRFQDRQGALRDGRVAAAETWPRPRSDCLLRLTPPVSPPRARRAHRCRAARASASDRDRAPATPRRAWRCICVL